MTTSPARRLIVAYAALTLLLDLSVFLPGGLVYEGGPWGVWGLIALVGFQALVVWPLWHEGSSDRDVAWLFAVAFAALYVAMTVMQTPLATAVLWFVLSISQLAILWTSPIRAFVWAVGDSPAEPLRQ
jgi:hypothetical protein